MVHSSYGIIFTCDVCREEYVAANDARKCEKEHQDDCIHNDVHFYMNRNRLVARCEKCSKVGKLMADNSTFRTSYTMRVNWDGENG